MAKSTPAVKVTGQSAGQVLRQIAKELSGRRADVGVSADTAQSVPAGTMGVVQYAAINEFGKLKDADGPAIPERSFLRDTLKINNSKYSNALGAMVRRVTADVAAGDTPSADKALGRIGEMVRGDVVTRISSGIVPENAPYTIKKKTKGKGGKTTTLIDSGRLRQSIAWQVTKVGKGDP